MNLNWVTGPIFIFPGPHTVRYLTTGLILTVLPGNLLTLLIHYYSFPTDTDVHSHLIHSMPIKSDHVTR